ncbi:hypothetical protein OS493_032773 [Desmophyllum pertusum]|uniref:Uncharacterized protein n=1 Tax=Desmophyllum pertusum TaxID=174260 RepID=A0A9X0D0L8_9CNID|nr:hypothetical protein OS493_032773 [Desmophyllum pertusum]
MAKKPRRTKQKTKAAGGKRSSNTVKLPRYKSTPLFSSSQKPAPYLKTRLPLPNQIRARRLPVIVQTGKKMKNDDDDDEFDDKYVEKLNSLMSSVSTCPQQSF